MDDSSAPSLETETAAATTRGRGWIGWVVAAALAVFALGLIANPWFERNVRNRLPGMAVAEPQQLARRIDEETRRVQALETRVTALEDKTTPPPLNAPSAITAAGEAATGDSGERLARLEGRVDAVAQQRVGDDQRLANLAAEVAGLRVQVQDSERRASDAISAAAIGADRAQAVLLVTATRRALELGQPLGAFEPALQQVFGAEHRAAVDALLQLARAPVTRAQLERSLIVLQPGLLGAASEARGSWWQRLKANMAGIVEVRRTGAAPAQTPEARINGALSLLRGGDVAGAVAQISRLPASAQTHAGDWLAAARRQVTGMRALAELEAAALAPPPIAATPAATPGTTP